TKARLQPPLRGWASLPPASSPPARNWPIARWFASCPIGRWVGWRSTPCFRPGAPRRPQREHWRTICLEHFAIERGPGSAIQSIRALARALAVRLRCTLGSSLCSVGGRRSGGSRRIAVEAERRDGLRVQLPAGLESSRLLELLQPLLCLLPEPAIDGARIEAFGHQSLLGLSDRRGFRARA